MFSNFKSELARVARFLRDPGYKDVFNPAYIGSGTESLWTGLGSHGLNSCRGLRFFLTLVI